MSCYLALALITVVVLAATGIWNPFPGMWEWLGSSRSLSEPAPAWQARVGGRPTQVTFAENTVIVEQRTRVEARSLADGTQLWERKADWAAVAGGPADAVVAVGKILEKGYDLLDPRTGAVRRRDDDAVAVWTYRDMLLDARCVAPTDCTVTAWDPRGTSPLWSAALPGVHTGLLADNPDLLATRRLTSHRVDPAAGGPEYVPGLLGFPVDERVYVLNTATGRMLYEAEPGPEERNSVVGGRLLRIHARPGDGTCYITVTGRDPATGVQAWQRAGINLRTADSGGCAQREDPLGARNVLLGTGPDGRETVLDAYDGQLLWIGDAGEKVIGVDDRYVLVRGADGSTVDAHELGVTGDRWNRRLDGKSTGALTPYAAVLVGDEPDRVIAVNPGTGADLANLRTRADVLAVGPSGMIISEGREIGYVRFDGAPGDDGGYDPGSGYGDEPGPAPSLSCGGPKNEVCEPVRK